VTSDLQGTKRQLNSHKIKIFSVDREFFEAISVIYIPELRSGKSMIV
jgi:hypothetical protein